MTTATMTIEEELLDATGAKPKGTREKAERYRARLVKAVADLDESDWDELTEAAQAFVNKGIEAINDKVDVSEFPDAGADAEAEEEWKPKPKRKGRRSKKKAEADDAEADDAEADDAEADDAEADDAEAEEEPKPKRKRSGKAKADSKANSKPSNKAKAESTKKRGAAAHFQSLMIGDSAGVEALDWDFDKLMAKMEKAGYEYAESSARANYSFTRTVLSLLSEAGMLKTAKAKKR